MISTEMEELESGFNKGYFVDDTGTAGGQYPPTSNLWREPKCLGVGMYGMGHVWDKTLVELHNKY